MTGPKSDPKPHLEIVLPVFNEVENLPWLVKQLDLVKAQLAEEARVTYLFVNDGSKDGTRELLDRLYQDRDDLRVVDLIHNFGQGAALACGLDHCRGELAVFMDADGQDSPATILAMFAAWKRGARTVVAERGDRPEKGKLFHHAFYFLLRRLARQLPPINFGAFCLLDRSVVERLRALPERNRYFPGLVAFGSGSITSIRTDRDARRHGHSRFGTTRLVHYAITAIVSFSTTPVHAVSIIGLGCAIASVAGGFAILAIRILTTQAIPGWAITATAVMFGNGLQLLCIGLIGEYLVRTYEEVRHRPLYLVDRLLERPPPPTRKNG